MLRRIRLIWRVYRNASFLTRSFITVRGIVCPWSKILEYINENDSVLDIGCGHGLLLNLIKDRYPHAICAGYDHDQDKIRIARESAEDIRFFLKDEIGAINGSVFDRITIIDVLYSIPLNEWPRVFRTAYDRLGKDGVFIIKETVNSPRWKYLICLVQEFIAIKVLRYTKGSSPILGSVDLYLEKISENGFRVKEHKRVDDGFLWPHYLFVCVKS